MKQMMNVLKSILVILLCSQNASATFRDGYMSPQDLLNSINLKFERTLVGYSCNMLHDQDRSALGDLNLQTGEPLSDTPGTAFISYWDQCIDSYISLITSSSTTSSPDPDMQAGFEYNAKIVDTKLIPSLYAPVLPVIDQAVLSGVKTRGAAMYFVPFPTDPVVQKQLVAHWVRWVLGSDEEILSYGRMQNVDKFRNDLFTYLTRNPSSRSTLLQASKKVLKILFKRDEFLLYY